MFFSVKTTLKIAGKVYKPCICYEAKDALVPTIEKLMKEDKARVHDRKVFFQNGKILEKGTAVEECDSCDNNLGNGKCLGNSKNGMIDTTGKLKCFEKKSKKAKTAPVEELPSPEEIADNPEDTEGF